MKKYILTDANGNITNTYKLDGNVFSLPSEYEDITDHPEAENIIQDPSSFKMSKKNNTHEFTKKVKNDRPTMVVEVIPDEKKINNGI